MFNLFTHLWLIASWQISMFSAANPTWKVGRTVETQSGRITGRQASHDLEVSAYLGVPYAKPPIGNLRFAAPQKYEGTGAINATRFGFSCPITTVFGGGMPANTTGKNLTTVGLSALDQLLQTGDTFSEDCLTLNIWTKPQSGDRKKAVLVWILGGGFSIGRSSDPIYNGELLAGEQDVVVVSFNYRLNIFGFPGNPFTQNNLALLDQRLAIEWVRENIAAFGGDPYRMVLFGQSAGAQSVDYYSYAFAEDPIISGMIMQSGTVGQGGFTKATSAEAWFNVTSLLSCGDSDSDPYSVLSCMRNKSTSEITSNLPRTSSPFGSAFFWPTIDDRLVFSNYTSLGLAGRIIKVPLLIGNTDYEAGYYKTIASLYDGYLPDLEWNVFNTFTFSCPAAARAELNVRAGLPTWRYRYMGDFESMKLTTVPDSGAYHGSELTLIFGAKGQEKDVQAVGRHLRSAWAAFAKDPENGLKCYDHGWPGYGAGERNLIRLADGNRVGIDVVDSALYDSLCGGGVQ